MAEFLFEFLFSLPSIQQSQKICKPQKKAWPNSKKIIRYMKLESQ